MFFAVSGYVLSYRCALAIRQENNKKLYSALTSMTFRRGIRLFLPCIAISFVVLIAVFLDWIPSKVLDAEWSAAVGMVNCMRYLDQELFKMWTWNISFSGYYSYQL